MSVFVVMLPERNNRVLNRLGDKYPNFHEIDSRTYVLDSSDVSGKVADNLGLRGEKRVSRDGGVVFKLDGSYAGRWHPELWEWLKDNEDKF